MVLEMITKILHAQRSQTHVQSQLIVKIRHKLPTIISYLSFIHIFLFYFLVDGLIERNCSYLNLSIDITKIDLGLNTDDQWRGICYRSKCYCKTDMCNQSGSLTPSGIFLLSSLYSLYVLLFQFTLKDCCTTSNYSHKNNRFFSNSINLVVLTKVFTG